jgi:hypothetical protein
MNISDPKFQQSMWYMIYAVVLYLCATQTNNYVTPSYPAIYGGRIFGALIPITAASYLIFKPNPSLKIMATHWLKAALAGGVGILANQMDFTVAGSLIIALLYFWALSGWSSWQNDRNESRGLEVWKKDRNESRWLEVWKKDRTAYILSMTLSCLGIFFLYVY